MKGERSVEEVVMTRLLRVSVAVYGIITGLVAGLCIFIATNWLVLKGGRVVGPHLGLLGQFFLGYRVTFVGSLVGFAYGFVLGCVVGSLIAWLYNQLLRLRKVEGSASAQPTRGRGARIGR
jgi:hypothetical protein